MTLFSITARNIKKNFQNYFLYFLSMVFSIVVFYVFTSIQYNDQVAQTVGELTKYMLKLGAVSVAVFSAIFMGYSNSFFIRKRKKEVGLYSLLGLQKRQVARMLFYENLVMGVAALGVGIIVGSLFSKLFVMLFFRLMGNFVQVDFAISLPAIYNTCGVFLLIFIIISLYAYSLIYRFKLVDLFRAEQSGEAQPQASLLLALLSIILIITGYVLAFRLDENFFLYAPVVLITVILGSYGLFHTFMVFVIRLSKKNTSRYYRGMNLVSTTNLFYRIKSNATILATIAILSATAVTAMGMGYGIYKDTLDKINNDNPFSYVYWNNPDRDRKVNQALAKYPQNQLLGSVEISFISAEGSMPGFITSCSLISESNYNELAQLKGWEKVKISGSKDAVWVLPDYKFREDLVDKRLIIELEDQSRQGFHIIDRLPYRLTNNSNTWSTLVLSDAAYATLTELKKPDSLKALIVANQKESRELTAEIGKILPEYTWNSYYHEYTYNMELRGMLMFIGGFLGLVILLATGSIIYFRQLNEAQKEGLNYQILRNIGVSRSEIHASIRKQLLYIFLFPLIVGIAHSWVALMALANIIATDLVKSTLITIAVYSLIYLIYYILTVHSYNRIVNPESPLSN